MKEKLLILICAACICGLMQTSESRTVSTSVLENVDWTEQKTLENGFHLAWFTGDPKGQEVTMEIRTERIGGWSAIGFSPNGGMAGADMLVAWFDNNGNPQIRDMYGISNGKPLEDESNDYVLLGAKEDSSGTLFRFRRKWNTCDKKHDFRITNDTISVIFAYGDLNAEGLPSYHGPKNRGVKSLYLTAPTKLAPYPDDLEVSNPDITQFDILMNNLTVPGGEVTRHMCLLTKYPTHDRKHQIIGWRPLIQPENIKYVHHITVFECFVGKDEDKSLFEKDLGRITQCYNKEMPLHWAQSCFNVPIAWNHGAEGDMLPEHLGTTIGEEHGGSTYFMFEIHYDMPESLSFLDNSGIRIFMSDQIRPNELTSLIVASSFSGFSPLIPPGLASHTTVAACTSECTRSTFPPEGLTAFSIIFHAHAAATRLTLRQIRNGIELAPIYADNNYDWKYQQARLLLPERKILPGDMILLECEYNTTDLDKPTIGGIETFDEMCVGYINYYPKIDLASCQYQTSLKTFINSIGIKRVGGKVLDLLGLPYKPKKGQKLDPPNETTILVANGYGYDPFKNISVAQRDSPYFGNNLQEVMNKLPWKANGAKLSKEVGRKLEDGQYYAFCTKNGRRHVPLNKWLVRKPEFTPFVEKDDYCSL